MPQPSDWRRESGFGSRRRLEEVVRRVARGLVIALVLVLAVVVLAGGAVAASAAATLDLEPAS